MLSDPIALKAGATIYIEVDIHGQPFPSVAWFHGPRRLDDDARCTIETMDGFSVLRIKSVEETDAGEYKVGIQLFSLLLRTMEGELKHNHGIKMFLLCSGYGGK